MKQLLKLSACTCLLAISSIGLADSDHYEITNDTSYIRGDIDTRQHIYYPGDTIDVRVTIGGNTQLLTEQQVDIYLSLLNSNGKLSAYPVKNYQDANARKVLFVENLDSSILAPGTYHVALVATNPGGNPANVEDWYNGFAGLLDGDAILYSETTITNDYDGDGEWDDDFDRDGFYGDDDDVFEHYYSSEGAYYDDSREPDWEDGEDGELDDQDENDDESESEESEDDDSLSDDLEDEDSEDDD